MHLYLIFCKQLDFQYRVNICPYGNIFLQTSSFSWIVLHIIELVGVYCIFSLCLRSIHPLRSNLIQWITNKKQLSWYLVVLKRHFRCVTTKVKVCKKKKWSWPIMQVKPVPHVLPDGEDEVVQYDVGIKGGRGWVQRGGQEIGHHRLCDLSELQGHHGNLVSASLNICLRAVHLCFS